MHKQNLTSTCQVILPKEEFSSGCIYGIMRCIYGMIYCIYYKTRVNTTDAVVKKEKSFGNLQASQSKISILKQTHKSVIKLKLAPEISQRQFCTLLSFWRMTMLLLNWWNSINWQKYLMPEFTTDTRNLSKLWAGLVWRQSIGLVSRHIGLRLLQLSFLFPKLRCMNTDLRLSPAQ